MKELYALTALTAFLAAAPVAPALADDSISNNATSTYKPTSNGGYEAKDSVDHTDANGTTTAKSVTKQVDVDSHGNTTTTVDTKSSTDPKGLMNKTTAETHNKVIQKDGQTESVHKKVVDGKTVEDSDVKQ